jgi:hypothetical protein
MEPQQKVDEDIKSIMEEVLNRICYAKTEMCKREPMQDNPPLLMIAIESNEDNPEHDETLEYQKDNNLSLPYHIAVVPLIHKDNVLEAYDEVVHALPIRPFSFLLLCVEGYMREAVSAEEMNEWTNGTNEKDFKENPFSTVREGIILTAVDWTGKHIWNVSAMYRYDDNGVPVFDNEPTCTCSEVDEDEEVGGRIPDHLLATVAYMHLAVSALAYKELLNEAPKRKTKE